MDTSKIKKNLCDTCTKRKRCFSVDGKNYKVSKCPQYEDERGEVGC